MSCRDMPYFSWLSLYGKVKEKTWRSTKTCTNYYEFKNPQNFMKDRKTNTGNNLTQLKTFCTLELFS